MKQMSLKLENILINGIQFGEQTKVEDHTLYINK